MDKKEDIYEGLTKKQIASFKKEESNCESHFDYLSLAEQLLEASANLWLKKICLEQFKKEDYGVNMRKWISKLISINELIDAEELLKKAEKKVKRSTDFRELAELACSNPDFKNKYAKNFYEKALEAEDRNMHNLESLIKSVTDKNHLNDDEYTKNVLKIAVENCVDLSTIVSLIKLLKDNLNDTSVIDVLTSKGEQFCAAIKNIRRNAYGNPEECTIEDFLAFIENINDEKEVNNLLDFAIKITDASDLFKVADYYKQKEDIDSALSVLELAVDKSQKRYDCKEYKNLHELSLDEPSLLEKLDNYGQKSKKVKTKYLDYLDKLTPKIMFSKNMLVNYNLKCGRYLYIILAYKEKAKNYNYSICLDMEKRVVLGRRFDRHPNSTHWPNDYYVRWHSNHEYPTRVSNAMDSKQKTFTGLITIMCSDNFENFIKNEIDWHELEREKLIGNSEKFVPRFPDSKFLWEVSCKNGKLKNPSASFSDYCTEEEILNTLGDGKNIFELNNFIWENNGLNINN